LVQKEIDAQHCFEKKKFFYNIIDIKLSHFNIKFEHTDACAQGTDGIRWYTNK